MSALPNQVNFSEPLLMLPENTSNFLVAAQPTNGSTFGPGSIAQVDLTTNRGFLDPASLSIRYKITTTSASGTATKIVGTPAYTFINKYVCYANSQTIETISNYNTVANMLVNLQMSVADKLGQQYSLGYLDTTTSPVTNEALDGRLCSSTGETFSLSAPLYSLLGNSEKLIPLFLLQNMRLEFTFESLANVSSNLYGDSGSIMTGYSISNFEVVYNVIDFGQEIQRQIISENPKIRIKSSSYNTSIAPIASGVSGNINLIYNLRYASIKSAFLNIGGTIAGTATATDPNSANKNMDSIDLTVNNGDYSLQIAGISYPQKPLSTLNNKAGIMNELRRAMGSIFGSNVAMAINAHEFGRVGTSVTTYDKPGKFYVGINLQKLTIPSKAFFTGVSTQNSPISAIINTNTATNQLYNVMLIAVYDAIIDIDTQTKQVVIVS
jgi:hypothetical protein